MDSIIGLLITVVVGGFVVIYTKEINKTRKRLIPCIIPPPAVPRASW